MCVLCVCACACVCVLVCTRVLPNAINLVLAMPPLPPNSPQAINLFRDWLGVLMPHVMSKIDRVSYGLLSSTDLAKMLDADPGMPRSRRLCAVPYVGKDVPR